MNEITKYSFYRINKFRNETVSRIIDIKRNDEDFLKDKEYFSFSDEKGNHYLISEFGVGKTDFECTGSCFCDSNRRTVSQIVDKKLLFLVSALTSTIAIRHAKKQFNEVCEEELYSICEDLVSIQSSIDDCEPIVDDDGQYKLFRDEEEMDHDRCEEDSNDDEEQKILKEKKRINFNKLSTNEIINFLKNEEKSEGKFRVLGSKKVRTRVRKYYQNELPTSLPVNPRNNIPLYLRNSKELLSTRYERVVIGDHGAYVEISPDDINKEIMQVEQDQEWRIYHPLCKYVWYKSKKGQDKIYYQKNTVRYADYGIGYYYIDP